MNEKKSGAMKGCIIGCLAVVIIGIIAVVGGGFYLYYNAMNLVRKGCRCWH